MSGRKICNLFYLYHPLNHGDKVQQEQESVATGSIVIE